MKSISSSADLALPDKPSSSSDKQLALNLVWFGRTVHLFPQSSKLDHPKEQHPVSPEHVAPEHLGLTEHRQSMLLMS